MTRADRSVRARQFLAGRSWHLLRIALRHGLAYRLGTPPAGPERLRRAFEEAGGTFVKLGQLLALQPDVLPLAYCNALFDLMDRVPAFPYREVEEVFLEELGRHPSEVFDHFDRVPIASASIGQVHRAVREGRTWAVKVQRPDVDATFVRDLKLIRLVSRALRFLFPARIHWLVATLDEFVEWTEEELDYEVEARYMEELGSRSEDNPDARIPEVDWTTTTSRILTAGMLEGVTLLDHLRDLESAREGVPPSAVAVRLAELDFSAHDFAANIVDNFLGDVFRHGLFHADLHPANLFILPGNVVGYVDFGITGVLSRFARHELIAMTWAYARGDIEAMADHYLPLTDPGPGADIPAFRSELTEMAAGWFQHHGSQVRFRRSFTHVMLAILRLSHRTQVWPHRELVKYTRSVIAVDGLVTRFAPDFDLRAHLETFCRESLSRLGLERAVGFDRLIDQALAVVDLAWDGPRRLQRALEPRSDDRRDTRSRRSMRREARRASRLAFLALSFSALAHLQEPTGLGVNALSATLVVAVASLTLAIRSGWRWSRRRRGLR